MDSNSSPASQSDILLVDDNLQNLHILRTMLRKQGYKVRATMNGVLALKTVELMQPDLILLDINMPEMNGYEVCQQLKAQNRTANIPVIFLSALDEVADKTKAFESGGVDYITKPYKIQEVLLRIKNQLIISQQQKQLTEQNAQLQLLLTTTKAINEANDFHAALEVTLRQVCEKIGWDFGEFWIPNADATVLECGKGWYAAVESFEKFRRESETLTFAPNVGLVGRIWSSKQPQWIEDVSVEPERVFHRNQVAREVGIKACLGVPILFNNEVLSVLVFFKREATEPEPRSLELVSVLASQLSSLIQRKRAELALQALGQQEREKAQQLERALSELQRTQAQLVQNEKMASLGQLVAGIAHEINNPISVVYGNINLASEYARDLLHLLELYAKHYPEPVPEIAERLEYVEPDFIAEDFPKLLGSMKEGANRIGQIVLSLRNFSRLDEAERKQVDIHQGIDSTLLILQHRLKPQPKRAEIQVVKEYGQLPLVECYPSQLNQVFMNILSNAIDAIASHFANDALGGLESWKVERWEGSNQPVNLQTFKPSNPTIRIRTEVVERDWLVIRIADNGSGIEADVVPKIFDPFFTTKPPGKGTGLGLSISYRIVVDRHRGRLTCDSAPGQGTEFTIELPLYSCQQ